jgi:WYL_2, Sm-like SH3 beta-barrel fold
MSDATVVTKQATKKDELKDLLKNNVAIVTFNKLLTGETRVMTCTLDEQWIKRQSLAKTRGALTPVKKVRPENPDVLCVWDLGKKGWRSFNVYTVTNVVLDPEFEV